MIDELGKYKSNDHFFLMSTGTLEDVCNAPTKSGVYVVYALRKGKIELVYIGHTGELPDNGKPPKNKAESGGLKDEILNGLQFSKPRKISYKAQMIQEDIEALDIYWFVTHNNKYADSPILVAKELLQLHYDRYGRLPRWNNERWIG